MNIGELTAKYIKLRDLKKKLEDEHKERVAPLVVAMEKAEAALLAFFEQNGVDNVKCEAGTAYKSTRTSATVADMDAFLAFVKKTKQWHMLERRCAKSAVEEYIQTSGGDLPPGINYGAEVTVNVRRA